MNSITFYKYQGAGNDFVVVDDRDEKFDINDNQLVAKLCDRRFGIGADGLMLLRNKAGYDFEMVYYNSDGYQSSMCGNGGRCIVSFANHIGIKKDKYLFLAIDGDHEAEISNGEDEDIVNLKMIDVQEVEKGNDFLFLNTGSPHYVHAVQNIDGFEVVEEARKIRYNDRFRSEGTNVNFIEDVDGVLKIRTYERGVEDETLACGTGVTAAVIAAHHSGIITNNHYNVQALGGKLSVSFENNNDIYTNVWLKGPAKFVFKGTIDV